MNPRIPYVQAGVRNGRRIKDQIAKILWIIEEASKFHKTSSSASLIMREPLTVWITTNCGPFLKRWKYQTTLPISRETCNEGQEATVRTSCGRGT